MYFVCKINSFRQGAIKHINAKTENDNTCNECRKKEKFTKLFISGNMLISLKTGSLFAGLQGEYVTLEVQ
jgi:hypothetical protein